MKFIFTDLSFLDKIKIILKVCRHSSFSFELPDDKIQLEDGQGNKIKTIRVDE